MTSEHGYNFSLYIVCHYLPWALFQRNEILKMKIFFCVPINRKEFTVIRYLNVFSMKEKLHFYNSLKLRLYSSVGSKSKKYQAEYYLRQISTISLINDGVIRKLLAPGNNQHFWKEFMMFVCASLGSDFIRLSKITIGCSFLPTVTRAAPPQRHFGLFSNIPLSLTLSNRKE